METNISFDGYEKQVRDPIRFTRAEWLALLGTMICAAGYVFLHPGMFASGNLLFPGIGLTFSTWLMLAICMGYIGWRRLNWNAQSIFLLAASLLLSASYGIFSNNALRYMNFPILVVLCILSIYALKYGKPLLDFRKLVILISRAACSTFRNFPIPAFALKDLFKSGEKRYIKEFLMGLAICIPIIGVVLLLLCDADSIFGNMINFLLKDLRHPSAGILLWNLIRLLILVLLLFGFVYGINRHQPHDETCSKKLSFPMITAATLLAFMSIVYAVFVYIQCKYLFAGNSSVLSAGGYAEYARSGFFQLVAVAFITLSIVLPLLIALPESRCLRLLGAFVAAMTMVIIFSAFWRMRLYISEFGLTFLRALTLWGMLAISAAIIATLAKAIKPQLPIFRALFIFTICTWLLFNYCNVSKRIVEYNVSAYNSGILETIDLDYLRNMGPEACSAFDMLRSENLLSCEDMGKVIQYRWDILQNKPAIYDWSLSWLKL